MDIRGFDQRRNSQTAAAAGGREATTSGQSLEGNTMSSQPLKEKLQTLQCHFTWNLEVKDKMGAKHVLQGLALKVEHTEYRNHGIYLATKAYLYHRQGCYKEALDSLREAEAVLRRDHPDDFSRQVLVIYGNYAWVYYHLVNHERVEFYLGRVCQICQSLSSPEPYTAQIPEIHAQKGWSLLAVGFRNGEAASECFQRALREDESNEEFQAGLAISFFASWSHSLESQLWEKAKALMEAILCRQPQNYEVKVHLVALLERRGWERSQALATELAKNSLSPEDLRNAARVSKRNSLPRAIAILQQAIALAPRYHLLHYDLGVCYKMQLERAALKEKDNILAAAIKSFQQAVEEDPWSIFFRLELAQLHGEKTLRYAEEMYQNLLEELPTASKRCQQAIYLHWGDFLLHRKGRRQEALEMYRAGYMIDSGHWKELQLLKWRLVKLANEFQKDSDTDRAKAAFETLRLRPEFENEMGSCARWLEE